MQGGQHNTRISNTMSQTVLSSERMARILRARPPSSCLQFCSFFAHVSAPPPHLQLFCTSILFVALSFAVQEYIMHARIRSAGLAELRFNFATSAGLAVLLCTYVCLHTVLDYIIRTCSPIVTRSAQAKVIK